VTLQIEALKVARAFILRERATVLMVEAHAYQGISDAKAVERHDAVLKQIDAALEGASREQIMHGQIRELSGIM
jgi:hypothetical protein